MALEEPANDAPLRPIARRRVEPLRHFVKRQVWRLLDPGHDQLAVRVDPVRARVAAALVRLEIAALPVARHPSDRRRDANPKTCRGRPTGPACINRIYDATAKIDREGFGHAGWPPSPALMMNHKITPNGIPNDSIAAQSALDEIQRILGGDAAEAAPTSNRTLSFRFPPRGLKLEALAFNAFTPFKARFWRIIMESLAQLYAERFQKQVGPYNAPQYRKEMVSQTDFRKYDGMLRMVLDLTLEQADALEAVLEQERAAGRLVYGFHRSDVRADDLPRI